MDRIWQIPIDEHLVKFALKEFFEGQEPPFKIDERSLLGKQILFYLIDKRNPTPGIFDTDFTKEESDNETFEDDPQQIEIDKKGIIPIVLSTTLQKRSPNLLKLTRLNSFLDDQFKMYLRSWAQGQISIGFNRYQAIAQFMKFYDLDTDLLIKRYYQFILRIQNKAYKQHGVKLERNTNIP